MSQYGNSGVDRREGSRRNNDFVIHPHGSNTWYAQRVERFSQLKAQGGESGKLADALCRSLRKKKT